MNAKSLLFAGVLAIAVLLAVNVLVSILEPRAVQAQREDSGIGRYQITSWAAPSGLPLHHHGYIILDTVTGKVVENIEVYDLGSGTETNIP